MDNNRKLMKKYSVEVRIVSGKKGTERIKTISETVEAGSKEEAIGIVFIEKLTHELESVEMVLINKKG